jgi:hypothetical protein
MSSNEERFWAKVDKSGECWEWTAGKNAQGYGVIRIDGQRTKAHRASYAFDNGPIPEGLIIDHVCRNTGCVKPTHLRVVTSKQNSENLDGPHSHNVTSGVRGVYRTQNNKWQARVTHGGVIHSAGYFHTIPEAEAAVIALRNRLFTHNDADRRAS